MATKKAFLKYLGSRKWKKVKNSKIPVGKYYLKYLGNRKWKKITVDMDSPSKETNIH